MSVKGKLKQRLLGYRSSTRFTGRVTAQGDIRAKMPDNRVIFLSQAEVKLN